jgi:hypothetical protein
LPKSTDSKKPLEQGIEYGNERANLTFEKIDKIIKQTAENYIYI